jgi:hypothetical protein
MGLRFFYRSSQSTKLPDRAQEFHSELLNLLLSDMLNNRAQAECALEDRGPHLVRIMGHHRQYLKVSSLNLPQSPF